MLHPDDSGLAIDRKILAALQPLMEPCDRRFYSQRSKDTTERLGKSKHTIQRPIEL